MPGGRQYGISIYCVAVIIEFDPDTDARNVAVHGISLAALTLLRIIEHEPAAVQRAVDTSHQLRAAAIEPNRER